MIYVMAFIVGFLFPVIYHLLKVNVSKIVKIMAKKEKTYQVWAKRCQKNPIQ